MIWTPGHSAGHICLYDARNKVLLSGDHVLPHITPSVGLHVQATSNPLADYLDSLRLIGKLEAELVLPGHGEPFPGLPERTGELARASPAAARGSRHPAGSGTGRAMSGFELASRMGWSRRSTWDDLTGFERRMAVTEALAHIELLHARGQVEKRFENGEITYFVEPDGA